MLTSEGIRIRDKYLSLSEEDKEKFLAKKHFIILNEGESEDGKTDWEVEMSSKLINTIKSTVKENESFDEATSRFISDALEHMVKMFVEKEINIEELEKEGILESILDEFELNQFMVYHILRDGERIAKMIPYNDLESEL